MSAEESPIRRVDTLVHHYHHEPELQDQLQRVVMISLDEKAGRGVYNWAIENFIRPETDMVVLVHVRQIDIPVAPYISATGYLDEVAEVRRLDSHRLLKEFASELAHKKVACKAISMIGDPGTEIVRKVTETKTDVLIMGSRHLGVLQRTFLGSVSDHCVHHCPCTVIIARPNETDNSRRKSILSPQE